ncbi:hypothetical protein BVG16_15615 [Paenibacillus selenitireducens]|uniref:Uncharacterized protein n=1 Tax=Paenibacillus selenitireducens TaxID=1324314 RepID=A0A1T2X9M9_9BACL|nr:hypothetical protein [Paenibacillus selenitireducens]OPA76609.1 hypothetical protein BVG16_15615 [Paenibacillus selenitireducens]
MEETLIIYDTTGYIIYQAFGNFREPVGIPFLKVSIPDGKRVSKVDVSGETPTAVFEDLAKSDIELLKVSNEELKKSIAELTILIATPQI